VCEATKMARDLVNEPVNILNATGLCECIKKWGKDAGFKVEVLNKAKNYAIKNGRFYFLLMQEAWMNLPFRHHEYKPGQR